MVLAFVVASCNRVTEKGYAVTNFNDEGSTQGIWHTKFLLAGIGRGNEVKRQQLLQTRQTGSPSGLFDYKNYVITYDNQKEGMEQSFPVRK